MSTSSQMATRRVKLSKTIDPLPLVSSNPRTIFGICCMDACITPEQKDQQKNTLYQAPHTQSSVSSDNKHSNNRRSDNKYSNTESESVNQLNKFFATEAILSIAPPTTSSRTMSADLPMAYSTDLPMAYSIDLPTAHPAISRTVYPMTLRLDSPKCHSNEASIIAASRTNPSTLMFNLCTSVQEKKKSYRLIDGYILHFPLNENSVGNLLATVSYRFEFDSVNAAYPLYSTILKYGYTTPRVWSSSSKSLDETFPNRFRIINIWFLHLERIGDYNWKNSYCTADLHAEIIIMTFNGICNLTEGEKNIIKALCELHL